MGSLPLASGASLTGEIRDVPSGEAGEDRYNSGYIGDGGKLVGDAEIDGAGVYTMSIAGKKWVQEFVTGAPFWLDLPGGSITIPTTRGTTTDVGTIALEVRR